MLSIYWHQRLVILVALRISETPETLGLFRQVSRGKEKLFATVLES